MAAKKGRLGCAVKPEELSTQRKKNQLKWPTWDKVMVPASSGSMGALIVMQTRRGLRPRKALLDSCWQELSGAV